MESIASEFVLIQVAPARDAVLYEERPFLRGDRIQEQSIYSIVSVHCVEMCNRASTFANDLKQTKTYAFPQT